MLALVHPLPDPHLPVSSSRSSRLPSRRPSSSSLPSSSSSSSSRPFTVAPRPPSKHSTTAPLPHPPPLHPHPEVHIPPPHPSTSHLSDQPPSSRRPPSRLPSPSPSFDIHSYPSAELLRLLASLLSQIAATNDSLSPASASSPTELSAPSLSSRTISHPDPAIWQSLMTASRASLSTPSATLTFHARNIPTISLEAYLLRILKYCPTTNEVFLSLLVYFDRMSKLSAEAIGKTFVIDSYNIHRLVIAGVTVASKFFSDVFYTNSRYAKVGGLPQAELNQLELQFLLLNNFSLVISADEMQRYAEQLILFSQNETVEMPPPTPTPALDSYGERTRYEDAAETETESGDTTDDEPTIRPAYSSAGSSEDTRSLCSTETEGDEEAAGRGEGDMTPGMVRAEGEREVDVDVDAPLDHRMASS